MCSTRRIFTWCLVEFIDKSVGEFGNSDSSDGRLVDSRISLRASCVFYLPTARYDDFGGIGEKNRGDSSFGVSTSSGCRIRVFNVISNNYVELIYNNLGGIGLRGRVMDYSIGDYDGHRNNKVNLTVNKEGYDIGGIRYKNRSASNNIEGGMRDFNRNSGDNGLVTYSMICIGGLDKGIEVEEINLIIRILGMEK